MQRGHDERAGRGEDMLRVPVKEEDDRDREADDLQSMTY